MRTFLYLGIFGLLLIASSASDLLCPRLTKYIARNMAQKECWDGSDGSYGCCSTGNRCWKSLLGFGCHCDSECKGWSAYISKAANYNFEEYSSEEADDNVDFIYGPDDRCHTLSQSAFSAKVSSESCAKLWEKSGCSGNSVMLRNGTYSHLSNEGISRIFAVSGCKYIPQLSKEIKIYQNNLFCWFGSSERIEIKSGECTNMDEWWKDRVSMIKSYSGGCYKIWMNQDCTGESHCACGSHVLELKTVGSGSNNWNNNVRAVSLCNYIEEV